MTSTIQREEALALANEVRCHRANIKDSLRSMPAADARREVTRLVTTDQPLLAGMLVWDLLVACRSMGITRTKRVLRRAGIPATTKISQLTYRQTKALEELLR